MQRQDRRQQRLARAEGRVERLEPEHPKSDFVGSVEELRDPCLAPLRFGDALSTARPRQREEEDGLGEIPPVELDVGGEAVFHLGEGEGMRWRDEPAIYCVMSPEPDALQRGCRSGQEDGRLFLWRAPDVFLWWALLLARQQLYLRGTLRRCFAKRRQICRLAPFRCRERPVDRGDRSPPWTTLWRLVYVALGELHPGLRSMAMVHSVREADRLLEADR